MDGACATNALLRGLTPALPDLPGIGRRDHTIALKANWVKMNDSMKCSPRF